MKLRVTVEGKAYEVMVEVLEDAAIPSGAASRVEGAPAMSPPPAPNGKPLPKFATSGNGKGNGNGKSGAPPAKPAAAPVVVAAAPVVEVPPKPPGPPMPPWHDLTVGGQPGEITAPFPGVVAAIEVKVGDAVIAHDPLLAVRFAPSLSSGEKPMVGTVRAVRGGTVKDVLVRPGDAVRAGDVLVRLASAAPAAPVDSVAPVAPA